jgi:hypothetical protein
MGASIRKAVRVSLPMRLVRFVTALEQVGPRLDTAMTPTRGKTQEIST